MAAARDHPEFFERFGVNRFTSGIAVRWPRRAVALVAAILPGVLLLFAIASDVAGARDALDRLRVVELFGKSISATATVATIAVSMASLTLSRELRGVGGQERHHDANQGFRDRVRRAGGRASMPMALGAFLSQLHRFIGERAAQARRAATRDELDRAPEGVRLEDLLRDIELASPERAASLARAERPHDILVEALSAGTEPWHHHVRRVLREDGVTDALRNELETLEALLRDAEVGAGYTKTMNVQWGLSRMSSFVVTTALLALLTAFSIVLFYASPGETTFWSWPMAALVVASSLVIILVPFTTFASYLLRFVFVNARTLPTADFILVPSFREGRHQLYSRVAASSHR